MFRGRLALFGTLVALMSVSAYRVWVGRFTLNLREPIVARPDPARAAAAPTGRLLFIVLDGARADDALKLPALESIERDGALAELWGDLPTVSAAQYVSLLTGVTPQDSGRRNNDALLPVRLDSVAARVRAAGGTTAVMSDCVDWWPRLFPGDFDVVRSEAQFDEAVGLLEQPPTFTVIHLCAYDDAGHAFGAVTPQYKAAGERIDRAVTALLSRWGATGPIVITADHGHVDAGGHGGDEPVVRRSFLLARGPGVKAGGVEKGRLIDVAPTLSALLGLAAPASSEGHTLTQLLALEGTERARLEAADRDRLALLEKDTAPRRDALMAQASHERLIRAALALLGAALCIRWLMRTGRWAWLGFGAGLLALGLTAIDYTQLVGVVSLSAGRQFGELLLTTAKIATAAAFVALVLPAFVVLRRRSANDALAFLLAGNLSAALVAIAMIVAFGLTAQRPVIDSSWALALPPLSNAAVSGTAALGLLTAFALALLGRPRN